MCFSFFSCWLFIVDAKIEESTLLKPTVLFMSTFNEVETLKAYVRYARENLEKASDLQLLWKFVVELNTRYELNDLNGLIDEFMSLEKKYFELQNGMVLIPIYDAIRDQFESIKMRKEQEQQLHRTVYIQNGVEVTYLESMFQAALMSKFKITFYFDARRYNCATV